jgi:hypothetical protein
MSLRMRQFLNGCARIANEADQAFIKQCYRKTWLGRSLTKVEGERLLKIWNGEHFSPMEWLK